MTILMGSIKQETNTFSDVPATLETFASSYLHYGDDIAAALTGSRTEPGGFLEVLQKHGRAFIPTVAAAAISGGGSPTRPGRHYATPYSNRSGKGLG